MSAPICGDPKATEVILLGGCVAAEEDPAKQLILRLSTTDPDVERWWKAQQEADAQDFHVDKSGCKIGNSQAFVYQPVALMNRIKRALMDDLHETWGNDRSRARRLQNQVQSTDSRDVSTT